LIFPAALFRPFFYSFDIFLAEAAKKAFDAKVKESEEFVAKMKKEIEQVERRAKEKKALETSLHHYKQAVKENEACISKLESDLEKLSELRAEDEKKHQAELEATQKSVRTAEEYCAGRFAVFSETLSGEFCRPSCYRDLFCSLGLCTYLLF
jgi:septal ring factor EnvC (AmiA/AmiB activator)